MPPRPPACARAVRRQLFKTPESTHPFDDVSGNLSRRFASSVPGPLESRRRLGKRRLTQVSDGFTPTYPGVLWTLFPDVSGIKWDWQAPTDRVERQGATETLLPSWLRGLGNPLQQEDSQFGVNDVSGTDEIINEPSVETNIENLRGSILSAYRPRELHQLLESSLPSIKQNLTLGLISGHLLESTLHGITKDFRDASARWNTSPNQSLFQFYTACWEGMESCKVLGPMDFEGKVIDTFLSVLARLPFDEKLQDLATRILSATSQGQHLEMARGIQEVVTAWSRNWLAKENPSDYQADLLAAETALVEIDDHLNFMRECVLTLEQSPHSDDAIFQTKAAMSSVRSSMPLAEKAIRGVQDIIMPHETSARTLSTALETLPANLLSTIVRSYSDHIVSSHMNQENRINSLRYYWLSAISHLTSADDQLFLESWKKLEVPGNPFSETQFCHLILGQWASQGPLAKIFEVETCFLSSSSQDLASLLFSINKFQQNYLKRSRNLFLLLENLGKLGMVYGLLSRMRSLGLKLPITQLRLLVEIMSTYDANVALKVYGLHHDLRMDYRRFSTHFLQSFITTLIKDTKIHPNRLWRHLRIPIHESRPRHQRNMLARPVRQQTIELLNAMALEFARCETRSTRVALRSVLQCLYHLRVNNVPITPELSLAISHAVIKRDIQGNHFVGQDRLRYAISIVEEVEGSRVANAVDEMVFKWREYLSEKVALKRREQNVLRVGPID